MPTDYVVFIHGVNNRVETDFHNQAQKVFEQIEANITPHPTRNLKPVMLFWGNIAQESTTAVSRQLVEDSPAWQKIWFQDLRLKQVLPFVGDAALYLSRTVSISILQEIVAQAREQIGTNIDKNNGDRLHLVTHSWGTVILFDILFATRWEEASLPAEIRQSVEGLRSYFFGVANKAGDIQSIEVGLPIASLHTMGSPIALFNLINSNGGQSFNLTPNLQKFLESSAKFNGYSLPWRNFLHPGDPIAYPLQGTMKASLGDASSSVEIADIVTKAKMMSQLLNAFSVGLLAGGAAHSSYWSNPDVAKDIAATIQSTFPQT
jgi:hypothetical protein